METIQKSLVLVGSRLGRVPKAHYSAASCLNLPGYCCQHNTNGKERLVTVSLAKPRYMTSSLEDSFREGAKRKHMRRVMEADKKMRQGMEKIESEALKIIAAGKSVDILTDTELKKLLAWQQVENNSDWKRGDRLEAWKLIKDYKNFSSNTYEKWTDEDEAKLNTLRHQKT